MDRIKLLENEIEQVTAELFDAKAKLRRLKKELAAEKFPATTPCRLDFYSIRSGECPHANVVGTHDTINCANPKCIHYIK